MPNSSDSATARAAGLPETAETPPMTAHKTPQILVIKLGALGDFVQALGPMRAIRAAHPEATLTLLTGAGPCAELGRDCGLFDRVLIDPRPGMAQPKQWLALRRLLIEGGYQRIYDLQNSDRTSLYHKLFWTALRNPEWVGAAWGARIRNADPARSQGTALEGHIMTLGKAGITDIPRADRLEWLTGDASRWPGLKQPYILLVPGSAPNRPRKRWPVKSYGDLARHLAGDAFQPVIIGGPDEQDRAAQITEACPDALDLCGQTRLSDIAELARNASGAIGNDTGPMHIIGATGCPTLCLMGLDKGASDPAKHGPAGPQVQCVTAPYIEAIGTGQVRAALSDLTRLSGQ